MAGAAEVLQEVHVETYGALTKMEKADFILEQVRGAWLGGWVDVHDAVHIRRRNVVDRVFH